jgi:hypothetical protein
MNKISAKKAQAITSRSGLKSGKKEKKNIGKQRHFSVAAYKASGVYCFAKVGDGTKTKSFRPRKTPPRTDSLPLSLSLSLSLSS